MDRSLYIAMSGAKQTLLAQNSNANNLANMQTTGFKSDLEWFRSRPVFGAGYPTRVYAMIEKPGTNFSPGAMQTTGRDLDVAINGEGLIAVQGEDGKEVLYPCRRSAHYSGRFIAVPERACRLWDRMGRLPFRLQKN